MSERTYSAKTVAERKEQYAKSRALREEIRKNKIPFMTDSFLPDFYLSQGMILVGGMSGKGKSTACANVIVGYLNSNPKGTTIVITNEENTDSIYDRVACIMLGVGYIDFLNHRLTKVDEESVVDLSLSLTDRIEVVDDDAWDMSCLDDVKAVLEHAATNKVGLVLVDYYQTINTSRRDPQLESFVVLKKLGFYLKDYGRRYGIPVVVFAQLNPASDGRDMQSRVQNDKTVYNHAFTVIEMVPDFDTGLTKFIVHKDRFSNNNGKEVIMKYIKGKFVIDREDRF